MRLLKKALQANAQEEVARQRWDKERARRKDVVDADRAWAYAKFRELAELDKPGEITFEEVVSNGMHKVVLLHCHYPKYGLIMELNVCEGLFVGYLKQGGGVVEPYTSFYVFQFLPDIKPKHRDDDNNYTKILEAMSREEFEKELVKLAQRIIHNRKSVETRKPLRQNI